MFQYLFFCCSANSKDPAHTVSLEDINNKNPLITKNSENMNCITQYNNIGLLTDSNNNNDIKIVDEKYENEKKDKDDKNEDDVNIKINLNKDYISFKENKKEEEIINENPSFQHPNSNTHILTINNINNININFHGEKNPKNLIKFKEKNNSDKDHLKSSEGSPILKKIKTIENNNISGENSKEILAQNKSFISFSNITIKYNNNNNCGAESSNLSDTEILSSCELTLIGDIFFNKEIKIDRSCIKNNGIIKNRNKRLCEIKFGLTLNGSEKINSVNNIEQSEEKNNNKNGLKSPNVKSSKISSIKSKQKKKMQSSSFSSLGGNAFNKYLIDIPLNLPYNKIQKKLNETNNNHNSNNNTTNNNNNNTDNIILFILKYDLNLDIFQLISTQDSVPVQLLLNYNFPLKFHQNYFIMVGGVKIRIRINKNENNESIINIYTNNGSGGDKKKSLKNYIFNPLKDKMPITIGRNICNINLDNISVSKVHAQIDYIFEYDEFFIIDCNSTNGTYLLLQNTENSIYIKQDLSFKLCESNFKIYYTNFEK